MNILVAVNDFYIEPLIVMLCSLFENNKDEISVYLLYSDISNSNLKKVKKIINKYKNKLYIYKIDNKIFDGIPTRLFSKETYYRLLCIKYLPENINRILFLDPDIIIRGSIKKLYNKNLDNKYFIGIIDNEDNNIKKIKKLYNINNNYSYINSGVLLINLKLLRKKIKAEDIIIFIKNNANKLTYLDQDVLNILFYKKISFCNNKYNFDARFQNVKDCILYFLHYNTRKKIIIVHYKGPNKPWKKSYAGKFGIDFYRYAHKAGMKNMEKFALFNMVTKFFNIKKQIIN